MRLKLLCGSAAALVLSAAAAAAETAAMFNRVATFPVLANLPADRDAGKETVAEIVAATADGMTLVYTDSEQEALGLVDISDPKAPKPAGFVPLDGEPTSVAVVGGKAYVAVNTSESFTAPSGRLAVVDLAGRKVEAACDLGGQPDSVAAAKDGARLAVVLENERDEELNEGKIPQLPSGALVVLPLKDGAADCAGLKTVALAGLADVAGDDAEAEFADVNEAGEAVVSLQENNHLALVDLAAAAVTADFSAGTVDLDRIDTEKDKVIRLDSALKAVPREPDAVHWLDADRFVTANEGDYEGGGRGFTIFRKDGAVAFESGPALEHLAVRIGHYPEKRAGKKGIEVEGLEVATFGDDRLIFVGAERAAFVAVYRDTGGAPEFLQALPTGIGPEGLLAIPERNLLVVANEADLVEDKGARSTLMIYERGEGPAAYPTVVSADKDGLPIAWGALSGLAADAEKPGRLFAVTDSFYGEARILEIDANRHPAEIVAAATVAADGKPAENLDLEGVALAAGGGFWLASEGNPEKEKKHLLVKVAADGTVEEKIELPEAIAAKAARFGLEGVAVTGAGAEETVWLAVQREWGDDPKGFVKLLAYRPASKEWGVVHYPLDTGEKGWVGLSELTATAESGLLVVERDNQIGDAAAVKRLYAVSLAGIVPAKPGETPPVVQKTLVRDLLGDLKAANGYVLDKVEGFAVDAEGQAFLVTDNDGVDDAAGETQFLRLGPVALPN